MKLKAFIEKLKSIQQKYGENVKVIMADNIPVVEPIYSEEYPNNKSVVITDKK